MGEFKPIWESKNWSLLVNDKDEFWNLFSIVLYKILGLRSYTKLKKQILKDIQNVSFLGIQKLIFFSFL